MIPRQVFIRGAGDLATGVAHRLFMAGFDLVMFELPEPLVVRRSVSFASAVYENKVAVENVEAILCSDHIEVKIANKNKQVAVLVDPEAIGIKHSRTKILIDARMKKTTDVASLDEAELVIGLGPGFYAGRDVHAVVETMRGPDLGTVIYNGEAAKNTGIPGKIEGFGIERLLKAPEGGIFKPVRQIGDIVKKGETLAYINESPVQCVLSGMIRGLLYPGLEVEEGMKIGDIDPRGKAVNIYKISDKARAVGGAVLEAILHRYHFDNISKL